jgi:hypothetical protein
MPWKACSAMEERLRFVARLLDGEGMSDLAVLLRLKSHTSSRTTSRGENHRCK